MTMNLEIDMKIAIIGAGNMGGSTARGLAVKKVFSPSDITVTAKHRSSLEKFEDLGVCMSMDNSKAVEDAEIVVIAVKPWVVRDVVEEILPALKKKAKRPVVVSMAAGVKSDDMKQWFDGAAELVYVIPNIAIEYGESVSFITPVDASQGTVDIIYDIFSKLGSAFIVDEKHLGAGTALASCGIAYALRYIRAAAEGGVELGMKADVAAQIVAQTVKGAAVLLQETECHPEDLIDKVTTPGGITIKGLNAMEEAGFTNAVIQGLKASK